MGSDNLRDYLITFIGDEPPITTHIIKDFEPLGPYGAKGVGEPALIPTAPRPELACGSRRVRRTRLRAAIKENANR